MASDSSRLARSVILAEEPLTATRSNTKNTEEIHSVYSAALFRGCRELFWGCGSAAPCISWLKHFGSRLETLLPKSREFAEAKIAHPRGKQEDARGQE